MQRDEILDSSAVEMAVLQTKVHVDKWHFPTFVPRNTALMSFSTHGVTQRMVEFTHDGMRVQPLQPLQAGTSVLIQSLSWIFFLRIYCGPNSALGIMVSSRRSWSHVSEQTLAPFAIWELEDHVFSECLFCLFLCFC